MASYHSSANLCQWDCGWFGRVLDSGYDKAPWREGGDHANWAFHPLFPLTAYPFHYWLKLSLATSLVFASKTALLLALYAFLLMIREHTITNGDRFRAGSLVAFNPYLIYAHAGYSEPLYFALLGFAFYYAGRARWLQSGIMSALLSATRLVGVVFCISYAMAVLKSLRGRFGWRNYDLSQIIGFLLCPLGTALYMLYLYHHIGDAMGQVHVEVAWGRTAGNPFSVLFQCLAGHHWLRIWGFMIVAGFLASAWLLKLCKAELGIYLALALLIPLSSGYYGIARYIWWQPPFLYAIYRILSRHTGAWVVYTAFTSGMAAFMIIGWFSGHNFVI